MQRYIVEIERLVDSMPSRLHKLDDILTEESVRIRPEDIGQLMNTFSDHREYFFEGNINTQKVLMIDKMYASTTGTTDEHDATIDATRICGHTHPNVSGRIVSPPSSFDVHAMVVSLKNVYGKNKKMYFSHIVLAPEGLYIVSINPIWITQKRSVIDYMLQETYQSFDVLTGGVPETNQSPQIDLYTYMKMSEEIGIHIQYYDDIGDGIDVTLYSSPIGTTFPIYEDIGMSSINTSEDDDSDYNNINDYNGISKKLFF